MATRKTHQAGKIAGQGTGIPVLTEEELYGADLPQERAPFPGGSIRSAVVRQQPVQTAPNFTVQQGNRRLVFHGTPIGGSAIPQRRTAEQISPVLPSPGAQRIPAFDKTTDTQAQAKHFHWLWYIGLAMVTMVVGYIILTMLSAWWQVTQDD